LRAEVRALKKRAIDSLLLAIELFNRPYDTARSEAVFMHLDHAFEMLLKATIVHKGGRIREAKARETISVGKCLGKCLSDADVKCLEPEQALTLQIINGMRDAAQHYILRVSEQQLYVLTQAGLTLFRDLLSRVFDESLAKHLPHRVMPVSTDPPKDLQLLMDDEFTQINALIKPGLRRYAEAKARLRPIAIMEAAVSGSDRQPAEAELNSHLRQLRQGTSWRDLLPGVSSLAFGASNGDLAFSLRITKKDGIPVRLVGEGEDAAAVVGVKRVNELDYYNLGFNDLAQKLSQLISRNRLVAVIKRLGIQGSLDYSKTISLGRSKFIRYSPRALDFLHKEIPKLDVDRIWHEHRAAIAEARSKAQAAAATTK
jgi:hypothetical protein